MANYSEALKKEPELKHLAHERWPEVLQEAMNWGLLSSEDGSPMSAAAAGLSLFPAHEACRSGARRTKGRHRARLPRAL